MTARTRPAAEQLNVILAKAAGRVLVARVLENEPWTVCSFWQDTGEGVAAATIVPTDGGRFDVHGVREGAPAGVVATFPEAGPACHWATRWVKGLTEK